MKQFIFLSGLFIVTACGSNNEEGSKTLATSSDSLTNNTTVSYPLPTLYSPTWETGDQNHAIMILNIGKGWLANDFSSFYKSFADSLSVYLANGDQMIGHRDSIIATMKNFRSMYSEIKGEVHSVVPLRHRDTKEDWVCVWAKEIFTTTQGKKDSSEFQESWLLNSEGKVKLVYQYAATIKPAMK